MIIPRKTLCFILCVLLSTTLLGTSLSTSPKNCKKHPIFCHAVKLQPNLTPKKAMILSNLLVRYSKKHQLDPWRSLAIAMQESSLRYYKRYQKVIVPHPRCKNKEACKRYRTIKALSDVGLFQLHASTVEQYRLDTAKLLVDLEYMVSTHFIVLLDKIKQCQHLGSEAWSCYHSKTPVLRKRYIKKVNRFYPNARIIK